jgi:hypothetical protein
MAASTTISRRGAKAAAAERAAKERKQLYVVIGLAALLVVVLAFEVPKLLSRGGGSDAVPVSTVPSSTPTTPPSVAAGSTTAPAAGAAAPLTRAQRRALRQPANDPFTGTVTPAPDAIGSVKSPAGLHDPFGSPSAPGRIVASAPSTTVTAPAIKGTIVIGKPGSGTVAEHGWIVILASIPTAKGKAAATSFAAKAKRAGVGSISILNSSNSRPLRGGYWVVYSGPFTTLVEVNSNASEVHGKGYGSAYIRQLIVYKKKS